MSSRREGEPLAAASPEGVHFDRNQANGQTLCPIRTRGSILLTLEQPYFVYIHLFRTNYSYY